MTRHVRRSIRSIKRALFNLSRDISRDIERMIIPPSPSEGIYNAFEATGKHLTNAMRDIEDDQKEKMDLFVDG